MGRGVDNLVANLGDKSGVFMTKHIILFIGIQTCPPKLCIFYLLLNIENSYSDNDSG